MPEHYTQNTIEVTVWCNKCARDTQHRVDGGRRGPCLECIKKREQEAEREKFNKWVEEETKKLELEKNPRLFDL